MAEKQWMGHPMTIVKKKATTEAEFAEMVLGEDVLIRTAHFDQIEDYLIANKNGLPLLEYALTVLREARVVAGKSSSASRALVYLPLMDSDTIILWNGNLFSELGRSDEPPSLYMLSSDPFKNVADFEEYRKPIQVPEGFDQDIIIIYRCFRSSEAIRESWEYSAGLYLFYRGDF
jgi:hypothetical protein